MGLFENDEQRLRRSHIIFMLRITDRFAASRAMDSNVAVTFLVRPNVGPGLTSG